MKVDKRGCGNCADCELLKGTPYGYCTEDYVTFAVCDLCESIITNENEEYIEYTDRKGDIKDFCCSKCLENYVLDEMDDYIEVVDTDFEHSDEWHRQSCLETEGEWQMEEMRLRKYMGV